jgi:Fe2+ or Zn2+ uptake regulation protein
MDYEKVFNKLKEKGYKITKQRKVIIEVLINCNKPISIEEWLLLAKRNNPNINQSTIYRNIDVLEDASLLNKIRPKDDKIIYSLNLEHDHSHFLICKKCGKAEPIECCINEEMIKIMKDKQFNLIEHNLELYGYCNKCNKHIDN